ASAGLGTTYGRGGGAREPESPARRRAGLGGVPLVERGGRGVAAAPAVARALAIATLTGRPAETLGVRFVRRGDDVLSDAPGVRRGPGKQVPSRRRRPALGAR